MTRVFARLICCCFLSLGMLAQQQSTAPPDASGDFHISGTVVDSLTGQPLPQTRVAIATIAKRDAFTTIVTADDGRFLFPGLAPGKYTLTAQRRGYLTQAFNQHDQFATSIAVGPSLASDNLVFRLTGESAISGTVIDEQGDPVRDARIVLFQSDVNDGSRGMRQRGTTLTDDEGFYRFAHLQQGKYFVTVAAEPWYAQHTHPRNTASLSESETALMLEHPGVIYTIMKSVSAGAAEADLSSLLDVAYPVTFYPGVTEFSAASVIVLEKGEKVSADIHLRPVPALHLRVAFENPEQAQQSYAMLEQKMFDGTMVPVRSHSIQVAPGVMELVGIVPGHYIAKIQTLGGGNQPRLIQERELDVSQGGEIENSRVAAFAPVIAAVRFEPAAAMPKQASVQLRDKKSSRAFSEKIGANGEVDFKTGVLPGSYEVSLQNAPDFFLKSIFAAGAKLTGRTLEIKGSGPVKLTMTAAQGEGEVSGVVLREDKPVAGAMIVLVPADPANNRVLIRRDQSDSDGTFTLSDVVPGRYTLLAIENGWDLEWANPNVLKKFMAQGEALAVEVKGKHSVKVKVQ